MDDAGKCDVTKSTEAVNTGLNMHKYARSFDDQFCVRQIVQCARAGTFKELLFHCHLTQFIVFIFLK